MSRFFETLNYSSVNEDWRSEAKALKPCDNQRVLCVSGSGARPLDLLAVADAKVVCIDASSPQNHLLRLKIGALKALEFEEYTRFLGLDPAPRAWRTEVLADLELPQATRRYWRAHRRAIRRGVLYEGRFERHFRRVSRLAHLLRPFAIRELLAFDDLEAQRRFLERRWDTPRWRAVYAIVTHPMTSRVTYGDPAYFANIQLSPGRTIFDRMLRGLNHYLACDSFMAHLVLSGRLSPRDLPPHLTSDGALRIRARLDNLSVVDGTIEEHLSSGVDAFDRFSLSDVPSYLDRSGFHELVRVVDSAAAPHARIVIRQFLTRYALPESLKWTREPELERRLAAEGRDFAYEFIIASACG